MRQGKIRLLSGFISGSAARCGTVSILRISGVSRLISGLLSIRIICKGATAILGTGAIRRFSFYMGKYCTYYYCDQWCAWKDHPTIQWHL
jgi:hypothetical protein